MDIVDYNIIIGTRPNIVKAAALLTAIRKHNLSGNHKLTYRLIHTGQHYDDALSSTFINDLDIDQIELIKPIKKASWHERIGQMTRSLKDSFYQLPSKAVIVFGDVDSTLAAALAAKECGLILIHIESGLRSGDKEMPEERNRILTDSISDLLLTSMPSANRHLIDEGFPSRRIHFVGNLMIDTLLYSQHRLKPPAQLKLNHQPFIVITIHRQSNTNNPAVLSQLFSTLDSFKNRAKFIFPAHPRTKTLLNKLNLTADLIHCVEPLPYFEFGYLLKNAIGVITDSGGVSEECTIYNTPCITLRSNTERPETVHFGTNIIHNGEPYEMSVLLEQLFSGKWKKKQIIKGWDGNAGKRIVGVLVKNLEEII